MPHFLKRCALTGELYDLIVELRPSVTAAGLAENIRRTSVCCISRAGNLCTYTELHLLTYHKQRLAYLRSYEAALPRGQTTLDQSCNGATPLRNFSKPQTSGVATQVSGYDNRSISEDLVSDVFRKFVEQTRQAESEDSLRTKTGEY